MTFATRSGGCGCGNVRYDLVSDPITVYACHCTDCQTESGSSFTLSMFVETDAVRVTAGEPQLLGYALPDGRERRAARCPRCEVALWHLPRHFPELLNLQPGTLDDTSWVRPVAHIFTRSRQAWFSLPADVLSYDERPDDILPMVRAWKQRPPKSQ